MFFTCKPLPVGAGLQVKNIGSATGDYWVYNVTYSQA